MKGKTMKKLLLILSSASILVSAGTTSIFAISYNNQNDRVADEMIDVYSKTLAYAMRNSILLDVNNLDDTWASRYNYTRRVKDVLPEVLHTNPTNGLDDQSLMDQIYATTFGLKNYNFTDDHAMVMTVGTNSFNRLRGLHPERVYRAPEEKTAATIQLVAGSITAGLGNGVSPQLAGVIANLLTQSFVTDAIGADNIQNIIKTINDMLVVKEGNNLIGEITNALTEKAYAVNDLTFEQVLKANTNKVFKALLIFIAKKTVHTDDDSTINYSQLFFDHLAEKNDDRLVDIINDDYVHGASYVLSFINSFARYLIQFDQYKLTTSAGPEHQFDQVKTDREIVDGILNAKYKTDNPDDLTWFKQTVNGQTQYYNVVNIQDLIANLKYYLVPNPKIDPNGTNLQKLMTILFENGDRVKNPFGEIILTQGIGKLISNLLQKALGQNFDQFKNQISKDGKNKAQIEAKIWALKNILNSNAASMDDIIGDLVYNVVLKLAHNEDLNPIYKSIKTILDLVNLQGDAGKIVKAVTDLLDSPKGQGYLAFPFQAIYRGNLIPDLIDAIQPNLPKDDQGNQTDLSKYKDLKNLSTILTTNIKSLLETFGVTNLPDFLYHLKSVSISSLITKMGEIYNIDEKTNQVQINAYWNSHDLENLVNSLTSTGSGVVKGEEKLPLLLPMYYAILGSNQTLNPENVRDKVIIDYLQGVTIQHPGVSAPVTVMEPMAGGKTYRIADHVIEVFLGLNSVDQHFYEGSLLYNLSRLYGLNYSPEEFELNKNFVPENERSDHRHRFQSIGRATSLLFKNVLTEFANFTKTSIDEVVNDVYKRYFDNKNFEMSDLKTDGFNSKKPKGQYISFTLTYTDPDSRKKYTYHLKATKGDYGTWPKAHRGFVVHEFLQKK